MQYLEGVFPLLKVQLLALKIIGNMVFQLVQQSRDIIDLNHSFSLSALFQYAFEINNQKLSNAFIVIIDLFGSEMHFSAGSKIGG